MTQVQDRAGMAQNGRRAPAPHSEAVQEAKRLEKMQTISSSHRTSGPMQRPAAAGKEQAS
jgi:hypothetical protein